MVDDFVRCHLKYQRDALKKRQRTKLADAALEAAAAEKVKKDREALIARTKLQMQTQKPQSPRLIIKRK